MIAAAPEDRTGELANPVIVLDDKHGLAAPEIHNLQWDAAMIEGTLALGEKDPKGRAVAEGARDRDVTAALTNDAEYGREAEARTLALLLRGEEWLEDALLGGLAHAMSAVRDFQDDVWSR